MRLKGTDHRQVVHFSTEVYLHEKKMTSGNFQFKFNIQRGGDEQTDRNGVLEK